MRHEVDFVTTLLTCVIRQYRPFPGSGRNDDIRAQIRRAVHPVVLVAPIGIDGVGAPFCNEGMDIIVGGINLVAVLIINDDLTFLRL